MSSDDIPKLLNESSESSDEENWEELEEAEAEEVTRCLFSEKSFTSLDEAIIYLKASHNFDLAEMKTKYSMDFYSYIKVTPPPAYVLAQIRLNIVLDDQLHQAEEY